MCGIAGYVSKKGHGPKISDLRSIILATETRGKHAFGMAWIDPETGKIKTFKRPGAASDNPGDLDRVKGSPAVILHCRYATHGDPQDNRNNHPHHAGSGWIVHNGVVRNYRQLERDYRMQLETCCDSEVLGKLIAHFPGPLDARGARMAEEVQGPLAILGLWTKPIRLLLVRNGNPLSYGENDRGYYFGSLPFGLPGIVTPVPDGYADVIDYTGP